MIALSGCARAGKDTFFNLMCERWPNRFFGIALGDTLKREVDEICKSRFNISAFTQDSEEKKKIRPTVVQASKANRAYTNGKYYTNSIQECVNKVQAQGIIPVVKDIRYAEYTEDEVYWAIKNKALLIHITRYDENGNTVHPANEDEALNDPVVHNLADFKVFWRTTNDKNELLKHLDFLEGFLCPTIKHTTL